MLRIITGDFGGGKTYTAVYEILEYLRKGGYVYTNIAYNLEEVKDYLWRAWRYRLRPEQLNTLLQSQEFFRELPAGTKDMPVKCVIDEASEWFDSYDKVSKGMQDTFSFTRQQRKVSVDVDLITQELAALQKRFRMHTQYVLRSVDLQTWLAPKCRIPLFKWARFFRVSYFAKDGKTFHFARWIPKDKGVYLCYNTDQLFRDLGMQGKVVGGNRSTYSLPVWVRVGAFAGALSLYMAFFPRGGSKPAASATSPRAPSPASASVSSAASVSFAPLSSTVRIKGFCGRGIVLLSTGELVEVGKLFSLGFCESVSPRFVVYRDFQGRRQVLRSDHNV